MKEEFKKYLAMILAVFCTAALSILFFFILFRLEALRSGTKKVLDILMPFIYGAGIAYILKPICNTYERFLEKHWHLCGIGDASAAAGCEHIQNGTVAAADGGQYQQYGGSFV